MALATAQHAVGDGAAMSTYRRALAMVQESGLPDRVAMIHYNMGLLYIGDGDSTTGLKHLYRASDILVDAQMNETAMADRIEDAILSAGGRTLARASAARSEYMDDERDQRPERAYAADERAASWSPGESWQASGDQLDYPPDELYKESTLPPN